MLRRTEGGYGVETIQLFIGDKCLMCGKDRGPIENTTTVEGGQTYHHNAWTNPCSHYEDPKRVRAEGKEILAKLLRDQREVKITCHTGTSDERISVEMLWNKTWDLEKFQKFLDRYKEDGWISTNHYTLDGIIYIDMTESKGRGTIKGTAKLITHTREELFAE